MARRAGTAFLFLLCLALLGGKGEAKVLGEGVLVNDRPVVVVASASAYRPSRLAFDVATEPRAPVRARWWVLCFRSRGAPKRGQLVAKRPLHRRVGIPARPQGLCVFEVEASFVDPDQAGRIEVTLRGHVEPPPYPSQAKGSLPEARDRRGELGTPGSN